MDAQCHWADGTKERVDLTGLIYRSRHFRRFLDHHAAFRKVRVADFGGGIEMGERPRLRRRYAEDDDRRAAPRKGLIAAQYAVAIAPYS
jgi:hypothetical protein